MPNRERQSQWDTSRVGDETPEPLLEFPLSKHDSFAGSAHSSSTPLVLP